MTRRTLVTVAAIAVAGTGTVAAIAVSRSDGQAPIKDAPGTPAADAAPQSTARGYRLVKVLGGLGDALFVTAAPGDGRSLYVVTQSGRVLVVQGNRVRRTFLDVSGRISSGGERGLLGLAFHPGYATNRRLFVDYTDRAGDTRVVEFTAAPDGSRADPASARVLLGQKQPFPNHNGGMLAFGPDRRLYIGLGDGGSAGDPLGSGQDLGSLLGKILRIDVDGARPYAVPRDNPFAGTAGARGEIWHYGLRNPWRFSFDRSTGDMWIGDVGQNRIEEVDRAPAGVGGLNFGWNAFEGTQRYGGVLRPGSRPTKPVTQYSHAVGISVTGGYVYRGAAVPALRGRYLFADYGTRRVWSIRAGSRPGGLREETGRLGVSLSNITSFGEGPTGELYVIGNGALYRFAPR